MFAPGNGQIVIDFGKPRQSIVQQAFVATRSIVVVGVSFPENPINNVESLEFGKPRYNPLNPTEFYDGDEHTQLTKEV